MTDTILPHPIEVRRALYRWSPTQPRHIRDRAKLVCANLYMLERSPNATLYQVVAADIKRLEAYTSRRVA